MQRCDRNVYNVGVKGVSREFGVGKLPGIMIQRACAVADDEKREIVRRSLE